MRRPVLVWLAALALQACSEPGGKSAAQAPGPPPVAITQFYASPPNPPKGERSLVCYSTENATTVRLHPPDHEVWPSPSRCFEVVPTRPLKYTLTAERGLEQISKTVTVTPGAPRAELMEVGIDAREVPRGTPLMVCYKARNAARVTVTPGNASRVVNTPDRGCVQHVMRETTTFKVRVLDAGGAIVDGEDVEVRVK